MKKSTGNSININRKSDVNKFLEVYNSNPNYEVKNYALNFVNKDSADFKKIINSLNDK